MGGQFLAEKSALVGVILFVAGVLASPYLLVSNVANGDEYASSAFQPEVALVGGQVPLEDASGAAGTLDDHVQGFEVNASATFSRRAVGEDPLLQAAVSFALDPRLKEGQQVRLAPRLSPAQNATIVYDPLLQGLHESAKLAFTNGTKRLYSFLNGATPAIAGLADLPGGARITSNLPIPLAEQPSAPKIKDAFVPNPLAPQQGRSNISVGLVRDHTILFYLPAGIHYPRFELVDLNQNNGADTVSVTIRSLDGDVLRGVFLQDDGNIKKDGKAKPRPLVVEVKSSWGEWVMAEIRNTTIDIRLDDVILPAPGYVSRTLNLGGPASSTPGRFPLNLTILTRGGEFAATPQSAFGLQTIQVTDEAGNVKTLPATTNKAKVSIRLEEGTYRATLTNGSVLLQLADGYFSYAPAPLAWPVNDFVREDAAKETLTVTTPLRGNHALWTRVTNGTLRLNLTKQDLNANINDDNLTLTISGLNGAQVHQVVIPDDGNLTNRSVAGPLQRVEIHLQGLASGTYRIDMKGSGDYRIREIEINPNRLVLQRLFPVGYSTCCFKTLPTENPLDLYYAASRAGQVSLNASHTTGLQDATFTPMAASGGTVITASVGELRKASVVNVAADTPYRIRLPNQNLQVIGNGFFSFTPSSFFYPYKYDVVPYKANLTYLRERADYVLLDYGTYAPLTILDGEGHYLVRKAWDAKELDLRDGKFVFTLQVTNYGKPGYENKTAYFRNLEVELQYKPFWKGNGFLEWIHEKFG